MGGAPDDAADPADHRHDGEDATKTAKKATAAKKAGAAKSTSAATGSARRTTTRDALDAGAARASGERARRRGTPLIAVPSPRTSPLRR